MTNEHHDEHQQDEPPTKQQPYILIPRGVIYGVILITAGSFLFTLFGYNPYREAARYDLTERSAFDGLPFWAAIFIGIPCAIVAYKKWIAPLLKGK